MKKVLLIRRKKEYFFHGTLGWYKHEFSKGMIYAWNFIFGMKYIHFRKELVKLAQNTISQNDFDLIFNYEDREGVRKLPPGSILFPIDEDDWIYPGTFSELEREFDGRNMYWDVYRFKTNGYIKYHKGMKGKVIESCGYCVVLPVSFGKITYHGQFKKDNAKYINKIMSLKIDSPASVSIIRKGGVIFEEVIENIHGWISSPYQVPEEFQGNWNMYQDLLKELLGSCKIPYDHLIKGI